MCSRHRFLLPKPSTVKSKVRCFESQIFIVTPCPRERKYQRIRSRETKLPVWDTFFGANLDRLTVHLHHLSGGIGAKNEEQLLGAPWSAQCAAVVPLKMRRDQPPLRVNSQIWTTRIRT